MAAALAPAVRRMLAALAWSAACAVGWQATPGLAAADASAFQDRLSEALQETLQCGAPVAPGRALDVEAALRTLWTSLPKGPSGRIGHSLLRYAVHHYFRHEYSIMIRGLESSRPVNQSLLEADIVRRRLPPPLRDLLRSEEAHRMGFGLRDAVQIVLLVERAIADDDAFQLEMVYKSEGRRWDRALGAWELKQVLEHYLHNWLHNTKYGRPFSADHAAVLQFILGQISMFDFDRQRNWKSFLAHSYSFDDAAEIVDSMTKSFAYFWDGHCSDVRHVLTTLDRHGTGRVDLASFYLGGLHGGASGLVESEDYLQKLGVLDGSKDHGKDVIIPNYIESAPNCAAATTLYLVCCPDHCEDTYKEIEAAVAGPTATPRQLLEIIGNMTSQLDLEREEEPDHIGGSLSVVLNIIASEHGGVVPLHGRLFAQWLHYAFPRECPFPHQSGATPMLLPSDRTAGWTAVASHAERHRRAQAAIILDPSSLDDLPEVTHQAVNRSDVKWMSLWTFEEELAAEEVLGEREETGPGAPTLEAQEDRCVTLYVELLSGGAHTDAEAVASISFATGLTKRAVRARLSAHVELSIARTDDAAIRQAFADQLRIWRLADGEAEGSPQAPRLPFGLMLTVGASCVFILTWAFRVVRSRAHGKQPRGIGKAAGLCDLARGSAFV